MVYSFYPFIQLSSHEEQLQGFLIFIYCDRLYFPKLATFHMLFQNLATSPKPCKLILSQEPPNVTSSEMKDKYLLIYYFLVCIYACVCAKSLQSCRLFVTPRTIAGQAPLFMGFSSQEYQSGWSCPPPGDLPNPGIQPTSLSISCTGRQALPLAPPGNHMYI